MINRTVEFADRHALALIVVGGLVIRFATLGVRDFWFDEIYSIEIAGAPFAEVLPRALATESNPPLYYMLLVAWERVFGDGEYPIRSLSAVLGVAAIPLVHWATLTLSSRRAALIAAALTASSPLLIWYSQEARAYALLVTLCALTFLCFAKVISGADRRWLWGWAIASLLALSTFYLAGLLIAAEAVWMLVACRRRRGEVALAAAAVLAGVLMLAPMAAAQRGHFTWIADLDFGERLLALPQHLVLGLSAPIEPIGPIGVALVLAGGALTASRLGGDDRGAVIAAGAVGLLGFALSLAGLLFADDYLISRNLISLWVPFGVALAILLASAGARGFGTALAAGLSALGVGLALWNAAEPAAGRPDWGGVVAALGEPRRERVISGPPATLSIGPQLENARRIYPGEGATASEVDLIEYRPVDDYSIGPCWWVGFCGGEPLLGTDEPAIAPPPGFELVDEGETGLFRWRRYVAARPVALDPIEPLESAYRQSPQ